MNQSLRCGTNFGIFAQLAVGYRVPTSCRAWRRSDRLQLQSLRWRRFPRFLRGRGHRPARPDLLDTVAYFGTPWVPNLVSGLEAVAPSSAPVPPRAEGAEVASRVLLLRGKHSPLRPTGP